MRGAVILEAGEPPQGLSLPAGARANPSRLPTILAGAASLVAILIYYRLLWGDLPGFAAAIDHCPDLFCDFRLQFYPTGRALLLGGEPVQGYFYGAPFACLLSLFAITSLPVSLWLWGGFQVAALVSLFLGPLRDRRLLDPGRAAVYVLLFFGSVPILHNLKWGQVSVTLVASELIAFRLYDRSHKLGAALLLAIAIAIKFYPAIFLLYFVLRRDGAFVLVCLGATIALFVLPAAWIGWERTFEFQTAASRALVAARDSWIQHDPNSQFLPHVVRRLCGFGSGRGWVLGRSLAYGGCAVLFLVTLVALRRGDDSADQAARMLFFLSTPLWVPTSWPHYFCYLPACQWMILNDLARPSGRSLAVTVVAGALVSLSVALSSVVALQVSDGWYRYSSGGHSSFRTSLSLSRAVRHFAALTKPKPVRQ